MAADPNKTNQVIEQSLKRLERTRVNKPTPELINDVHAILKILYERSAETITEVNSIDASKTVIVAPVLDGQDGEDGLQGIKGDKGDAGSIGAQGIQGVSGTSGMDGQDGDDGEMGFPGVKGEKGDAGSTGSQGAQGLIGIGIPGIDADPPDEPLMIPGQKGDTGASGVGGGITFTTVEKDLGALVLRSGTFDITGLSGLTADKQILVNQANAVYTGKGTLKDESEMNQCVASGYVLSTTSIRIRWACARFHSLKGNVKFNYAISG